MAVQAEQDGGMAAIMAALTTSGYDWKDAWLKSVGIIKYHSQATHPIIHHKANSTNCRDVTGRNANKKNHIHA